MQVTHRISQPSFNASPAFQPSQTSVLEWLRILLTLAGAGLAIAAILTFQQFLLRLYATHWQMALLFALMGLMVALLLGQYRLDQTAPSVAIRWSALSSLMVTMFGLGVVICILTATPPIS